MVQERFCVAGHCFSIHFDDGNHKTLLPSFTPFVISLSDSREDVFSVSVTPTLCWEEDAHEIGQFDCGGNNHGVYLRGDGGYQFEISDFHGILCARVTTDKLFHNIHAQLMTEDLTCQRFGLGNCMMLSYSFATCGMATLLVHASVIRHDGKGYLMTAPSGTGKSTHTRLWYENIPGCDLMNDDNPVIRIIDGTPIVYGTPWSGKTPCYRNIEAPIGGIVRIQQRPENKIRQLAPIEAFTMMLPSCNNMKWDSRVYRSVCSSLELLIQGCRLWELGCRPDAEAAHVCHDAIV